MRWKDLVKLMSRIVSVEMSRRLQQRQFRQKDPIIAPDDEIYESRDNSSTT